MWWDYHTVLFPWSDQRSRFSSLVPSCFQNMRWQMYHKGLYKEIVCWMYLIGSADKLLSKCRCSVFSTFALLVIFFTEETIDWYSRLFFCLCYSSKKKKIIQLSELFTWGLPASENALLLWFRMHLSDKIAQRAWPGSQMRIWWFALCKVTNLKKKLLALSFPKFDFKMCILILALTWLNSVF